jgi:putative FmdB family regulatory protein
MPVYDYRCDDCGHEFEVIESLDEHEQHERPEGHAEKCPKCESLKVERVITSVNVQLPRKS